MSVFVLQNRKSKTLALRIIMVLRTLFLRTMFLRAMISNSIVSRVTVVSRATLILIAIVTSLLSACSLNKPLTIDSHLSVLNRSSHPIKLIQRQNCRDAKDKTVTLIKDLRSGEMKKIDAMETGDCVNLLAYDYDNVVIARQKNLSFPPGFTWIIY